ncbi:unnamed protein product [Caretta caretta]
MITVTSITATVLLAGGVLDIPYLLCKLNLDEDKVNPFYLLPKIHKPGNPGRPIISGIGTLTAGLSGYVGFLFRHYATSTPSYLQDTTDFLRKLQSIGDLPENTILATMDVEALYTNIPHRCTISRQEQYPR